MNSTVAITLLLLVGSQVLIEVHGHGVLTSPTARSSFRWSKIYQEYLSIKPDNTYDVGQYCGDRGDGTGNPQKDDPGIDCGVCGDDINLDPRPNEHGGEFDRGIITARYLSGQAISVVARIVNPHLGTLEWRLCTDVKNETQECFDDHILPLEDPNVKLFTPTKINVTSDRRVLCTPPCGGWRTDLVISTKARLPKGITCEHCVLQWNYRTGLMGIDERGVRCYGCGPRETFRNCADIKIVSYVTLFKHVGTQKCFSQNQDNEFELADCDDHSTEQYIDLKQDFEDYKTTPFYLQSMFVEDKCLDVEGNKYAYDRADVIFYECTGYKNQKWYFDFHFTNKANIFQIKTLAWKCLIPTGRIGKRSLEIRTCTNSVNEFWEVVRLPIPENVL